MYAVTTLGNRTIKGFCCHRQIDPETRTDPGNGYPYDLLMQKIRAYMGSPDTNGGISPQGTTSREWYEMALDADTKRQINEAVRGGPGIPMIHNNELGRGEYAGTTLAAMTDRIVRQQILPLRAEVATQTAITQNLVSALNAVAGGEKFDEAKLLAGIEKTAYEASKAGAAAGVQESIDSIEKTTTVNIKEG